MMGSLENIRANAFFNQKGKCTQTASTKGTAQVLTPGPLGQSVICAQNGSWPPLTVAKCAQLELSFGFITVNAEAVESKAPQQCECC